MTAGQASAPQASALFAPPGPQEDPIICPNCGSPDVREVVRYGPSRGDLTVYYVDRGCLDCSWYDRDTEGGV